MAVGAVSSYTFSNTSANHTIDAVFSVEEVIEDGLPYYIDGHGNNDFIGFASDVVGTMKCYNRGGCDNTGEIYRQSSRIN